MRESNLETTERTRSTVEFHDALAAAEGEVATPVIPGELRSWCALVRESLERVRRAWVAHRDDRARRLIEIRKADLALAQRVENLAARDDELGERLGDMENRLTRILGADAEAPQASHEPSAELEKLRQELLAWVAHCRGHDKEIDAWIVEALYRDRGGGD